MSPLEICLSLEQALLILLLVYVAAFVILGSIKGRRFLLAHSNSPCEYYFHTVSATLTLAGLAIAVLSLFIGLGKDNLGQLSSIILFFSIAFVAFVISLNLVRFPRRIFIFIADILVDTGIISIGSGFLVFFAHELPLNSGVAIVYAAFIVFSMVLVILELWKYYRFWSAGDC